MGNISSQRLDLHRFLGMAVCYSTTIDPRHLEHHNYTYWTGDIAALIVRGKLKCCLIAPQFPIYVSPKETLRPNSSFGSGKTRADGEAQGVYVDIAIVMPIVQPRHVEELGVLGKELDQKSLHDFLGTRKYVRLSPRCLWVSGFEVPLIAELKPGPTRHADEIDAFYIHMNGLLKRGVLQAEAQVLCLFCSSMFGTQVCTILLAGAGEYYRVRLITRLWASEKQQGQPYSSAALKKLKRAGEEFDDGDSEGESDDGDSESEEEEEEEGEGRMDEVDDGDWTEGREDEMYGDPLSAHSRQQQLNAQRTQRRLNREARLQKYADALNTRPSKDRTGPLFSDEALNSIHKNRAGRELFQSITADLFFKTVSTKDGSTEWSDVLRLGSTLSNQYMAKIQRLIRAQEIREEARRKQVFFTKADNNA